MPVNCGWLGKLVPEMNDDVVTFVRLEARSGDLSVVRVAWCLYARQKFNPCLLRHQRYFDGVRLVRFICENRLRMKRCAGKKCNERSGNGARMSCTDHQMWF